MDHLNLDTIKNYTMISIERIKNLVDAVTTVNTQNIEGSLVECGVWKCGALGVMSLTDKKFGGNRKVFGFDSFEGLPSPKEIDGEQAKEWDGLLKVTVQEAEENLATMGASATLIKGLFSETLKASRDKVEKIAILRLDGDWYESTMTCLDSLYDLVVPGGYIIIDDYGHWQGCRQATDDFRAKNSITAPIAYTDYTEVWWRKL